LLDSLWESSPLQIGGLSRRQGPPGPFRGPPVEMGWTPPAQCRATIGAVQQKEMAMKVVRIGLDVAKNVFQIHGVDENGAVALRRRLRRSQVIAFFGELPQCLV